MFKFGVWNVSADYSKTIDPIIMLDRQVNDHFVSILRQTLGMVRVIN